MYNYFPDTNLLIFYVYYVDDNKKLATELIEKVGKHSKCQGFLLDGVNGEFDHLSSGVNRVLGTVDMVIKTMQQKNSTRLTFAEIKRTIDTENKELNRQMAGILQYYIDKSQVKGYAKLTDGLYTARQQFRMNTTRSKALLYDCKRDSSLTDKTVQTNVVKIKLVRDEIERCYPISKDPKRSVNDKRDNEHILNSLVYCMALKFGGYFVTDDNLRYPQRDVFIKKACELRDYIKKELGADLSIYKFRDFLNLL